MPSCAHAQKCGVRYSLGVGSDAVVLGSGEVDVLGAETGENVLDFGEGGGRGAVGNEDLRLVSLRRGSNDGAHQWLAFRVNFWAV